IQNDLIESVTIAINENIQKEINDAAFVSIQADETTDVSDKTAEGLSKQIITVLEKYNVEEKLVFQTYDGASVMSGRHGRVQAIIRRKYARAIFVHCYAHQLNLVLLHSAKTIKEVKLFICNLTAFHSFFSRSSFRAEQLRQLGFQLHHPAQTRWNYNSRAVSTIEHHYQELRNSVNYVTKSDDWDPESVNNAMGLLRILDSLVFTFILCLFNKIFIFTEHLFNVFQTKCTSGVNLCVNEIRTAKSNISSLWSEKVLHECLQESMQLNTNNQEDF
ncbi:hypothetical protein ANN_13037, partial [Periplaneta americana]